MTDNDRLAILLELAGKLRANGSWTGETHIQKAAYLLQHLLKVPAGFRFILYTHGPFSFDLRASLGHLEAVGAIVQHEQPYPYGAKIADGPAAPLLKSASSAPRNYQHQIGFIARQLGSAKVADLERIATALFIELDSSVIPEKRAERLTALKPHIPREEAPAAFTRLNEIRAAAVVEGLAGAATDAGTQAVQAR